MVRKPFFIKDKQGKDQDCFISLVIKKHEETTKTNLLHNAYKQKKEVVYP